MRKQKSVLVTGAGRGIGRAIALRLVESGFEVFGCARNETELLESQKLSAGQLKIASVDVTDEKAVEAWVQDVVGQSQFQPWGLVTAAGTYGPIGDFANVDWQEWKAGIDLNLYGSLYPAKLMLKHWTQSGLNGRLVFLSGGGATKPIVNFTNYCAAKSAIVRVAETLAEEYRQSGITVNCLAPGAIATALTRRVLEVGPDQAGKDLFEQTKKQFEGGGQSPEHAANLTSYLMSEDAGEVTGKLISAIWDPWENLHTRTDVLKNKDHLTLRRTVPENFSR